MPSILVPRKKQARIPVSAPAGPNDNFDLLEDLATSADPVGGGQSSLPMSISDKDFDFPLSEKFAPSQRDLFTELEEDTLGSQDAVEAASSAEPLNMVSQDHEPTLLERTPSPALVRWFLESRKDEPWTHLNLQGV